MFRKIGIVAVLLVVGVAIAMYMRRGPSADTAALKFTPRTGASETERIADLEKTLAAQVDRSRLLESRVAQLESRRGAQGTRPGGTANGSNDPRADRRADFQQQFGGANGNLDPAAIRDRIRQRDVDRLVQGGFTQDRADWINRRTQELEVQGMQAQYDAQRSGQPVKPVDTQAALRKDMGDAEYEKYLTALGRPTDVQVMDVLASSAAEKSGLKPGDQIVSYAGSRVFDMNDLNAVARDGTPGESVTVEVQRDGQTMQLQVPRGVLGVQSAGGGRGGGFPGGGFRGGGGGRPGGGGGG